MKILIPPPPPLHDRINELSLIEKQYNNRVVDEDLQQLFDQDIPGAFDKVLVSYGMPNQYEVIKDIKELIVPIIIFHKEYFSAPRPTKLAKIFGLNFRGDDLESAYTPSYPSGHTAQAFYIAYVLSVKYPHLSSVLLKLAELISLSRIDRGVHFPSDIVGGKMLADKICGVQHE
jgi:hypothetical protein